MRLTKAERKVLTWIVEEWDSDWIHLLEMNQDGAIDFKVSQKTIDSLIEKGLLLEHSEMHTGLDGLNFFANFVPVRILEAYTGVEFTKLVDPNGKSIISLYEANK